MLPMPKIDSFMNLTLRIVLFPPLDKHRFFFQICQFKALFINKIMPIIKYYVFVRNIINFKVKIVIY